jgi:hypothetical protein
MRIFADHDKVANFRVPIDPPENPRLPFNSRISSDAAVWPVHLRYIMDPSMTVMRQRRFIFNVPTQIPAPDIAEIPERPDSIHGPITRSQKIAGEQFIFLRHARLLTNPGPAPEPGAGRRRTP